jgi:hypothetical protein
MTTRLATIDSDEADRGDRGQPDWRQRPVADVAIDSSVAVAWALPNEHLHPPAMRLIDQLGMGRLEPFVAAHFGFEVRRALVRAARAGRLA